MFFVFVLFLPESIIVHSASLHEELVRHAEAHAGEEEHRHVIARVVTNARNRQINQRHCRSEGLRRQRDMHCRGHEDAKQAHRVQNRNGTNSIITNVQTEKKIADLHLQLHVVLLVFKVKRINAKVGETVEEGRVIVELE